VRYAAAMSAKDEKEPIPAGAPAEGGSTTDWSNLGEEALGTGVPDGLHKTADWTGAELSSGVPDGLNKTADWSDIQENAAPVRPPAAVPAGAPNINTTDWTDRPVDPEVAANLNSTAIIPTMARQERAARLELRKTSELKAHAEEAPPATGQPPMLMIAVAAIVVLLLVVAGLGAMLLLK